MGESGTAPATTEAAAPPATSSGLTQAEETELKNKVRCLAKWQVTLGCIAGPVGLASIIYSQANSGRCLTYPDSYYHYCYFYLHYPSFGIGVWCSILTIVAGSLAICATSSSHLNRQRIIAHIVFAMMAVLSEFGSGIGGITILATKHRSYTEDLTYTFMIVVIMLTCFIKAILLIVSIVKSFKMVPNCCNDCQQWQQANTLYASYPGQYPGQGTVVVQRQGGIYQQPQTMMMTPQGPMMMQPGMQMQPGYYMQPGMQMQMQPGMQMQAGMMQMQPGMMQMQPGMQMYMQPGMQMQPGVSVTQPPPELAGAATATTAPPPPAYGAPPPVQNTTAPAPDSAPAPMDSKPAY